MSEQHGRDWVRMTPDDFDREAPLRLDVPVGATAVPAVPDECGTSPLFGDERPSRGAARPAPRSVVEAQQEELF
ncbi:hypothetical protein ABZT03_05295 [Streptomyces sp. NPDC005574]|uniref:hypothetical protein n=1 Tax=Streptomyces sp. NPDC005574 TaxID=3156891 RepID=UPI0033B0A4BF